MKHLPFLTALVLVCAVGVSANAKTAGQATDGISKATHNFITNAVVANHFEIDSSKLALDRSHDAEVRSFASMMIEDHTAAIDNLKAVTPTDAAPFLGAEYDTKHEKKLQSLKDVDGKNFDAAYIKAQTDAHNEAVALFGSYAKSGDEKDLKDFAAATLPTLKAHQAYIRSFKKTADGYTAAEPTKPMPTRHKKSGDMPHAVER